MIVGALLLAALPEVLRYVAGPLQQMTDGRLDASILRQLLIALAMIGIMLARPRGLWPSPEHGESRRRPSAAAAQAGRPSGSRRSSARVRSGPRHIGTDHERPILKVSGVSKRFGGLQALSDVGITIRRARSTA